MTYEYTQQPPKGMLVNNIIITTNKRETKTWKCADFTLNRLLPKITESVYLKKTHPQYTEGIISKGCFSCLHNTQIWNFGFIVSENFPINYIWTNRKSFQKSNKNSDFINTLFLSNCHKLRPVRLGTRNMKVEKTLPQDFTPRHHNSTTSIPSNSPPGSGSPTGTCTCLFISMRFVRELLFFFLFFYILVKLCLNYTYVKLATLIRFH